MFVGVLGSCLNMVLCDKFMDLLIHNLKLYQNKVQRYIKEVETFLNVYKHQLKEEKEQIKETENYISNILLSSNKQAPSNSVLNSLFKDEENLDGFNLGKYEEKKKKLAEERRAEYNAFLEKKAKEEMARKRHSVEKVEVQPKSLVDSVNYEELLAKRKKEEAKFRSVNYTDINMSKPYPEIKNTDIKTYIRNDVPLKNSMNIVESTTPVALPNTIMTPVGNGMQPSIGNNLPVPQASNSMVGHMMLTPAINPLLINPPVIDTAKLLAQQMEEQRKQLLLEYENELRKSNLIREEIQNLQSIENPVPQPVPRLNSTPDHPHRVTGGGGEPVRDSFGNIISIRRSNFKENPNRNMLSLPSMQNDSNTEKRDLYREELRRQIEEKKRLEAAERQRQQELEAKIAERIEEQRLQMQSEYEEELKRNNRIKEEYQRQQQRIAQLQEFQRKDLEARRKKPPVSTPPPKPVTPPEVPPERSNSPPIPAVRTKALLEKVPPPTEVEVKPDNAISSLAEIRKRIMQDQQKKNFKKSYEIMNRQAVQEISDDDDDDFMK